MGIVNTVLRALVWWKDQSFGTQLFTWRNGVKVGEDAEGNRYFRTADDSRRWVVFNGEIEASRVSPDWHGWLHRTFDNYPGQDELDHKEWEKPHQENLTGTLAAYVPSGSLRSSAPADRKDYEAWQPE